MRAKRQATYDTDRTGRQIVRVPLANSSAHATLLADDYARLRGLGMSENWVFNSNGGPHRYVRCGAPCQGNLVSVARILCAARPGVVVRYLDGDRTNLHRDNLALKSGKAKRADASLAPLTRG
jgi:hypothetical protein